MIKIVINTGIEIKYASGVKLLNQEATLSPTIGSKKREPSKNHE
jgi:hypothetical protein